jgi:hypothetical protein
MPSVADDGIEELTQDKRCGGHQHSEAIPRDVASDLVACCGRVLHGLRFLP